MKLCWTSLTCFCWASYRVLRNNGTERRKGWSGKWFGNQLPDDRQRHCHTFERYQMKEKGGWGGGRLFRNTWQVSCFFPTQTNASQKKLEQNRLQCQKMQSAWAACALVSCSLYCCSTKMQIIFLRLYHSRWTFHEQQRHSFLCRVCVCVCVYLSMCLRPICRQLQHKWQSPSIGSCWGRRLKLKHIIQLIDLRLLSLLYLIGRCCINKWRKWW